MKQKLDEASYQEGRVAFAAGATLKQIVEQCMASDTPADEAKTFSSALSFADALIDVIRQLDEDRKPF